MSAPRDVVLPRKNGRVGDVTCRGNFYEATVPTSSVVVELNEWLDAQPRWSSGQPKLTIFGLIYLHKDFFDAGDELNAEDELLRDELEPIVRKHYRDERLALRI